MHGKGGQVGCSEDSTRLNVFFLGYRNTYELEREIETIIRCVYFTKTNKQKQKKNILVSTCVVCDYCVVIDRVDVRSAARPYTHLAGATFARAQYES